MLMMMVVVVVMVMFKFPEFLRHYFTTVLLFYFPTCSIIKMIIIEGRNERIETSVCGTNLPVK